MNFRGLLVLIILQLYQDTVVSAFDRDAIETYLRDREAIAKAKKEVDPGIQLLLENFSTKINSDVKKELAIMIDDLKGYQKRSLIATSEYLTKAVADEIKPIKEFLISLNGVKNVFHEELTAKVRSSIKDELKAFQRMELEALVLQVKNEIIESFQAEFVDVKTALQLEGASMRDLVANQTKVQAEESSVNQQADARMKQLEEKCQVKRLVEEGAQFAVAYGQAVDQKLKTLDEGIQNLTLAHHDVLHEMKNDSNNDVVERLEKKIDNLKPNSSCELTPMLELIKTAVETIKNDRDARSDQLITKLVDKIGRLLTVKLKFKTTSCELSRSSKSTLAAIKAATDTLVETAATSDEENKLEEKFKALLTELNANTTVGFDGVKSKLNAITKTVSSSGKSCREIKSSLASELDKFSKKQVTSIKTAIGDVLANVLKSKEPELGAEDGDKSVEMSKLEDIEILVREAKDKVKIKLGEVEGRILKAFNETIVDRLIADGKGCIEARGFTGGDDSHTGSSGGGDTKHTGDDMEHTGDDTKHSKDDTEHTRDDTEHSGGSDTEHSGGSDTEHSGGSDTEHSGGSDKEHSGGSDKEHSGGDDTEHSGGDDTEHTDDDTEHSEDDDKEDTGGDNTEHSGGDDTEHTEDNTEHSGDDDKEDTGGDNTEHSGGDDTEHTEDNTEHSGDDDKEDTGGDDTKHSGGDDTVHSGDDTEHSGDDDKEDTGGDDTEHTGGDDTEGH